MCAITYGRRRVTSNDLPLPRSVATPEMRVILLGYKWTAAHPAAHTSLRSSALLDPSAHLLFVFSGAFRSFILPHFVRSFLCFCFLWFALPSPFDIVALFQSTTTSESHGATVVMEPRRPAAKNIIRKLTRNHFVQPHIRAPLD
jgi:hypothetical protein